MRCILILTNVCSATDRDVCRRQELKELRHRCKMAEEESATQSSARADMQDRLQAALDAIASGSEMAENTAIAELRRQAPHDDLRRHRIGTIQKQVEDLIPEQIARFDFGDEERARRPDRRVVRALARAQAR